MRQLEQTLRDRHVHAMEHLRQAIAKQREAGVLDARSERIVADRVLELHDRGTILRQEIDDLADRILQFPP